MKIFIIIVGTLLLCTLFLYTVLKHYKKELSDIDWKFTNLPSGKFLPSDDELIMFSEEKLKTFDTEDLIWLEDYALFLRNGASDDTLIARLDDFLRRINIAMNAS